jgi:LacI family repressor for deo operon, udp, cdd, tsx, nupC, and nupG
VIPGEYNMESGAAAADRIAALAHRPTAIFVANDEMSIGFISRLRAMGSSVRATFR